MRSTSQTSGVPNRMAGHSIDTVDWLLPYPNRANSIVKVNIQEIYCKYAASDSISLNHDMK